MPAAKGGTAAIPAGITIPPELKSGIAGSQVSINAGVGQTILVRCLCGAYNSLRVTFPIDVVIIEWDGRPLGVPPFGRYNRPIPVKANTPFMFSTARRFGAVMRSTTPINDFAKVEFVDTRGMDIIMTALVPFQIN